MSRLPIVGGDYGSWGTILNDYLSVAHNANGSLKIVLNVQDYGALLNGSADDSAAIQATIDAAYTAGGGVVLIPGRSGVSGVKINSPLELRTGVWLRGLGSCTALTGTADPMIRIKQDTVHDRMQITDLHLQAPAGVGINLLTAGALQLGWPRITVENVTVVDGTSHSFWLPGSSSVLETRLINCVSMRSGGRGFFVETTDIFLIGCTAAESVQEGFEIRGGNNKLAACKAYGNDQDGFNVAGAGRHLLTSCESQDNGRYGFAINGQWNTLAGCLADTDNLAGVALLADNNSVNGSFMYGGGGTGQVTKAGAFFSAGVTGNVVCGVSNCPTLVGGEAQGNFVQIKSATGSRGAVAFVSPWTPNPYDVETQAMTLTGGLTLVNPVYKHVGQRLTLELRQDGSGGHAVTFPSEFRTNWTPDTAADRLNVITFEYDGTAWQQISASVGITPKPSIGVGDTFNRANEVLNVSSSGNTWEKFNQAGGVWNVVSNQCKTVGSGSFQKNIAVLDAGVPDFTAQVTVVTQTQVAGLILRYSDSNNFLKVAEANFSKVVAGVETNLSTAIGIASGDVVKVVASGPNYFVYKNGTLVFTICDTFNVSATKAGVYAANDGDILDAFTIV